MKAGRTLVDLADELTRQRDRKQDYIADTRSVEAVPHDDGITLALDDVGSFGITPYAHRQLGDKLKVPARYYDRMLAEAPELLATNVNHWLRADPTRRMVRTLDGSARAFLSDRYRPLDNFDLAAAALPVLSDTRAEVASCEVTPTKFYLKAILPSVSEEIGPPNVSWAWGEGNYSVDVVQPGIVISNSEVGAGALSIVPAIHTVRCTNLTVWNEGQMRKLHLGRHNGRSADSDADVWKYMSDDSKRLSDAAVWSQVRDLVRASLKGDVFTDIVQELRTSRGNRIEGNPVKAVEVVGQSYGLNEDEQQGVLAHLTRGGELTQYGLSNAITRQAEDIEDYDRASELEVMGGQVVRLARNDWDQVASAGLRS